MTEPTQSGPYAGQPGPYPGQPAPLPQPTAPAPGWSAPPPQQGGPYPYATTPPAGHGRPPAPPEDPAAASDRASGALLILGALLAIGGSFATLDKSVQYLGEGEKGEPVYENVAKAWSYSSWEVGGKATEVTQFSGVPLLLGGLLAVVAAVLLLTGRSRRLALGPALGVAGAVLLLGTTLTVLTDAFNDTQWDEGGRTTTFGPGFYLLTVASLLALGATVTTVLAGRRPAGAFPAPAPSGFQTAQPPQAPQPPQPWPAD
ncbi:hypothetical protein [Streptomyces europaeiscabiei]|uniref:hypothetical protein n=1 Tax=Streptomyces europaeiscabiei TaxID=146819 RepID=UPI0029B4B4DE|nr:hypothetical protein [Streptomyces europaeiscabiei]MDX2771893.1 hypothetical protein [Streptomyces europaeiscabiei]